MRAEKRNRVVGVGVNENEKSEDLGISFTGLHTHQLCKGSDARNSRLTFTRRLCALCCMGEIDVGSLLIHTYIAIRHALHPVSDSLIHKHHRALFLETFLRNILDFPRRGCFPSHHERLIVIPPYLSPHPHPPRERLGRAEIGLGTIRSQGVFGVPGVEKDEVMPGTQWRTRTRAPKCCTRPITGGNCDEEV